MSRVKEIKEELHFTEALAKAIFSTWVSLSERAKGLQNELRKAQIAEGMESVDANKGLNVKTIVDGTHCPRCGNMEIDADYNYCTICGLLLKEKAPTDAATSCVDAKSKEYLNVTPEEGKCQEGGEYVSKDQQAGD